MTIKIIANDGAAFNPPGKLADAEVHFTDADGPLAGLKLIGFSVWERRMGGRNVTFPARSYAVNGERRTFALLRPVGDSAASDGIRLAILAEYDAYEHSQQRAERTAAPAQPAQPAPAQPAVQPIPPAARPIPENEFGF